MANPFSRIRQFYKETKDELKKANWPSFAEVKSSMLVVFVAIFLLGAFVSLVDFSVINVISLCTKLLGGN